MANYFNFYTNWQKAKDYDRIVKENKILVSEKESEKKQKITLYGFCKDFCKVTDYVIDLDNGEKQQELNVNPIFNGIIRRIDNLGKKISCLSKENKELNSQLQKRDKKTGRFVKK